jgi:hypothetical protein
MDLKTNINKIHVELQNEFELVEISEKSSISFQEYVEIKTVNEGKELIMIIEKKQIQNKKFNWKYYSNPIKKDYLVERSSDIDDFVDHVVDIFNKNRFDEKYLENLN